ncbi:unnamed protein product [Didymodactylos carnosus]|uniref:UBP-type domain-containing protein n=1 Tax=Didymodactylos carnosus TaxID=1234261 RepID=A0A813QRY1_9BILA|nr:unnamed protein product [Didymodactylos carnosus]CAF1131114.1 unnamed protein product [Didymodactylos carnosus]CAF3553117.1 unnamed protein product [Didymodactylos carnosus]CAF3914372.1 unnamed protein product [Didymodactylos carnosus]
MQSNNNNAPTTTSSHSATGTNGNDEDVNLIGPFAVVPKQDCPHVENRSYTLPTSAQKIDGHQPPCEICHEITENWVCLNSSCSIIGCSRYQQRHMLQHYETSGHNICLSLSDHSFYCFKCDSYIDHQNFQQVKTQLMSE